MPVCFGCVVCRERVVCTLLSSAYFSCCYGITLQRRAALPSAAAAPSRMNSVYHQACDALCISTAAPYFLCAILCFRPIHAFVVASHCILLSYEKPHCCIAWYLHWPPSFTSFDGNVCNAYIARQDRSNGRCGIFAKCFFYLTQKGRHFGETNRVTFKHSDESGTKSPSATFFSLLNRIQWKTH